MKITKMHTTIFILIIISIIIITGIIFLSLSIPTEKKDIPIVFDKEISHYLVIETFDIDGVCFLITVNFTQISVVDECIKIGSGFNISLVEDRYDVYKQWDPHSGYFAWRFVMSFDLLENKTITI